ncbi:MAG: hypothetical protein LBV00_01025 [Propionibacteriaceae bacterium]|jgi:hypothetical protein|nr:hypothetical protein [Propionibacteriaceae bacterium]
MASQTTGATASPTTGAAPNRKPPSTPVTVAKASTKKTVASTTTTGRRMSGPRFFSWLRFGLVVSTLVAAVLGVIATVVSQADQADLVASQASSLNLMEMKAMGAEAQSDALSSLLDPHGSQGRSQWQAYTDATATMTDLLLTATGSTSSPTDLHDVAQSFSAWQSALFSVHQDGLAAAVTPDALKPATQTYTVMIDALTAHVALHTDTDSTIIVVAFVLAVLVSIGFVMALIATARRSHRVINIGVTIALLLSLGSVYVLSWYNGQTTAAHTISDATWTLTDVRVDTWDTRSLSASAILDPTTRTTSPTATEAASQLEAPASDWWFELSEETAAVVNQVATISAATPDQARTLILDDSSWRLLSDKIGALVSYTPPTRSLIPAFVPASLIAGLGAGAVIATLAGVHARTKEYA